MSIRSIDDFKIETERLLDVLARNIDDDYYPRNVFGTVLTFSKYAPVTFDFPRGDATPFIEQKDGEFHFVISERGYEFERVVGNPDEILERLFQGITFNLATIYGVCHRAAGMDSRRMLFSKQIELLSLLSERWAQSVGEKQSKILETYPYQDNS